MADLDDITSMNTPIDLRESSDSIPAYPPKVPSLTRESAAYRKISRRPESFLEVEGGQEVFFRGGYVTQIPLKTDSVLVGRRDVMAGHYPDIDLAMYRKQDPCISRRHLCIFCDMNGVWFVEDICNHNATFLNGVTLNHARRELKDGDRIIISSSIVLVFRVVE